MKTVQHSIRLPAALDTALRALADRQGKTVYAMLRRCVKAGIDGQVNSTVGSSDDRELVAEVASISTRLADVERVLDRADAKLRQETQRLQEIADGVLVSPWLNDALRQAGLAPLP